MSDINRFDVTELKNQFDSLETGENYFFKPRHVQHLQFKEPYRTETYGMGLITGGSITLKIDLQEYQVTAPSLICMGPNVIRQWIPTHEPLETSSFFLTDDFLLPMLSDVKFFNRFPFFQKNGVHCCPITESDKIQLETIFKKIEDLENNNYRYKNELLKSYAITLLYEISEIYSNYYDQTIQKISKSDLLVQKFKDLLFKYFHKERSVKFYAMKLFLHPKYFSQTIKESTGKTASDWINEITVLEAKVLLQNLDLTINEIAEQLHFPDASTFGKYFKKNTSKSPSSYRKLLAKKS